MRIMCDLEYTKEQANTYMCSYTDIDRSVNMGT